MSDLVIDAHGVGKRFGDRTTLDGAELAVPPGVVHGLLGPNGAGKTTLVRILATLLRPDAGRVRVAGFDVRSQPGAVRRRIGLVGQHPAVDDVLSGKQNLVMFGRLFHLGATAATRRAEELLDRFGLADTGDRPVTQYSGGMRRRLDLAAGLVLQPEVLYLDEPTTGLDPRGRNEVWEAVRGLRAAGTTVLLTTQYLDEADQLADRISIIDAGRVVATGTPAELKARVGAEHLDVVVRDEAELAAATAILAGVADAEPSTDADRRRVTAPVRDPVAAMSTVLRAMADAELHAEDVTVRRPTLDEAFLRLTPQPEGNPR